MKVNNCSENYFKCVMEDNFKYFPKDGTKYDQDYVCQISTDNLKKGIKMNKHKFLILSAILASFLIFGCNEDDNNVTSPTPTESNSYVQVIHSSPDAPGVDLLVDNTIVGNNLTFPNNTGYLTVTSGTRNIKVNVTGTTTTAIEANLNFEAENYYSIYAVNNVANIEPLVIQDDLTAPASGKAHVRFLHLSPNAPAVDITLPDGTVVFSDQSFKDFTDFIPLDSGTYDLQVRLAGTDTVVLDLNGISLEEGKIYSVFAKGLVNGSGEQALGAEIIVVD